MNRFDINEWWHTLSDLRPTESGRFQVPYLIGPRDACFIAEMRKRLQPYLSFGPPAITDYFLLTPGEASERWQTKIGGLPYWRTDRPWPVTESGSPIPFLAQFDLTGSRDLVPDPPADIVLIFAHQDVRLGAAVTLENRTDSRLLIDNAALPIRGNIPMYACSQFRAEVFPRWSPRDAHSWSHCELPDGTEIDDIYFAMVPLGVQIGRHPFAPPGMNVISHAERIICSVPSIAPRAQASYPFLDRRDALSPQEAEDACVILADIDDDEGFGVLYVLTTADGVLELRFAQL